MILGENFKNERLKDFFPDSVLIKSLIRAESLFFQDHLTEIFGHPFNF